MSEDTTDTNIATDATSDEEVSAAVEALVQSVETDGEVLSSRPKAKTTKTRAGRRSTDDTVDNLINTVNQLAGSVTTLAGTVETLGEKIQAPAPVVAVPAPGAPEMIMGVEVEEVEDEGSPLVRLIFSYAFAVVGFVSVGIIGWAAMHASVGAGPIGAIVGGIVAFTLIMAVQDRGDEARDLQETVVRCVAAALLVLGLGLFVGGIQFFGHQPGRAAALIPVGLALSAVGFVMRSPHRVSREHLIWMVGAGVWVCLGLFVGLGALGPSDPASATPAGEPAAAAGDHGAEAAATEDHGTAAAASGEHGTEAAATEDHGTAAAATEDHGTAAAAEDHGTAAAAEEHATPTTAVTATTAVAAAGADNEHIQEAVKAASAAAGGH